jgi:hypothetical protein
MTDNINCSKKPIWFEEELYNFDFISEDAPAIKKPLDVQVGGDHYKKYKIQPVEYNHANNLDYFQGNVVKYITRFRDKNGLEDLKKAKHYIDLLIQLEYSQK